MNASAMRELRFTSQLEQLPEIYKQVAVIIAQYPDFEKRGPHIELAVHEAIINAMYHGNKHDRDKSVYCRYHHEAGKLCFEISDEGEGFDPSCIPDPTSPENIEECNGRGLYIIRTISDRIDYKDEGRTCCLCFFADEE